MEGAVDLKQTREAQRALGAASAAELTAPLVRWFRVCGVLRAGLRAAQARRVY